MMNVAISGLALLLGCGSMGLDPSCTKDGQTLFCLEVPSTFDPGYLSLVMWMRDVGEINSTALHSDSLASVTRLTIDRANVTGIAPGALSSFQNLQNLSLNQNALTEINPAWFGQPAVLKDLSLTENRIEVLEESMLSGLIGLTSLNLAKNMIRTIGPSSLSFQTNLVHLDLSGNRLTRVSTQDLMHLRSTRMRLDGNPWDCSCGVEDFADYLKDLQNRSMLEKEMEVTCDRPVALSGTLVWNVSECVSTPPPPTSTTSTTTTTTETSTQPNPTAMSITVPTLSGIIVVLCLLLCGVCFLGVLYRQKRERKLVKPRPLNEEEEEKSSAAKHPKSPGEPEERHLDETINWDSEIAWRTPITGVRAKSANAVLAMSPFCVAKKDLLIEQTMTEGPSEDTENSAEEKKKLEMEADEDGGGQAENDNLTKEVIQKHVEDDTGTETQQSGDKMIPHVSVDTETIPYLSIGTDLSKPNLDSNKGQHPDGQGQRSQMGKVMGRVSTWPLTSGQWKARCCTQDQGAGVSIFTIQIPNALPEPEVKGETIEFKDEMQNISGNVSLECDDPVSVLESFTTETFQPEVDTGVMATRISDLLTTSPVPPDMNDLPIESSKSCLAPFETSCGDNDTASDVLCSEPNYEILDPQSDEVITSHSLSGEVQSQSQNQSQSSLSDPAIMGQCTISELQSELKNQTEDQAHLSQDEEPDHKPEENTGITEGSANQNTPETNNRGVSINKQKHIQTKGECHSSRQSREKDDVGSKAPSAGVSPGDENLLLHNEYVYINLLHEVVQNHGRWTRERWKQTNVTKQRYKHQGHQGHQGQGH